MAGAPFRAARFLAGAGASREGPGDRDFAQIAQVIALDHRDIGRLVRSTA